MNRLVVRGIVVTLCLHISPVSLPHCAEERRSGQGSGTLPETNNIRLIVCRQKKEVCFWFMHLIPLLGCVLVAAFTASARRHPLSGRGEEEERVDM